MKSFMYNKFPQSLIQVIGKDSTENYRVLDNFQYKGKEYFLIVPEKQIENDAKSLSVLFISQRFDNKDGKPEGFDLVNKPQMYKELYDCYMRNDEIEI